MKPNFALNLSHEGITLLHRATAGWLRIGSVSLDDPDLTEELRVLRKTATDLESGGLSTKLVIPNSQILYTEVDAPGPDTADRIGQIRDGLVGLTPYDVNDLVFDWRMNGKRAQVAVVARDTLREAESFATEYRFNPVSFVAVPENGSFDGEPFFGPTKHAGTFLSDGETVQPDTGKITVLGATSAAAEAKPKHKKKPARRKKTPAAQATEAVAVTPDGAGAAEVEKPTVSPAAKVKTDPAPAPAEAEAAPAVAFASRRRTGADSSKPAANKPPLPLRAELPPVDAPVPEPKKAKKPLPPPPPRRKVDIPLREDILDDIPPMPVGITRPIPGTTAQIAARAPLPAGRSPYPLERPATTTPITAPTTRRVIPPLPPGLPGAGTGTGKDTGKDDPAGGFLARFKRTAKAPSNGAPAPAAAVPSEAEALTVFGARTDAVGGKPRFLGLILTLLLLAALAALALWSTYFMDDLTSGWVEDLDEEVAAVRPDDPVTDPGGAITTAPLDEPAPDSGGAVLLTDEPAPEDTAPQGVDASAPDQPADGGAPLDGTIETALLEAPSEAASEPTLGTSDAPGLPATDPADAGPEVEITPPDPVRTNPLTQAEAEARYAATGIWQRDPPPLDSPGLGRLDDLFIASVDPQLSGQQALALPSLAGVARDARPAAPAAPPPLGTEYDFDERGLIRATPGGSVTPEGTLIFSGRPPVVPGPRPDELRVPQDDSRLEGAPEPEAGTAAAPDPTPQAEPETETAEAAPETTASDDATDAAVDTTALQDSVARDGEVARLSQIRPTLRPGTPADNVETASLGGIAPSALDDRPTVRPLVENTPETPAEDVTEEAADAEIIEETEGSDQAVAASLLPRTRPAGFAETVERALEEARASAPEPRADPAPQPRTETQVAAARVPDIPTSTSVAEQATERNAINLRRVNLIGVYGTPARRSALVRLPSGRFVKVEVGDRVDGGRVAAIGNDELRYVKGGRNITLKMPSG